MKMLDYLRLKLGLWISFGGKNKTATQVMQEITTTVKNTKCVHCGKNPFFKS